MVVKTTRDGNLPELSELPDFLNEKSQLKIIKYGSCMVSEITLTNSSLRLPGSNERADPKLEDVGFRQATSKN